jgi:hypothetical protein
MIVSGIMRVIDAFWAFDQHDERGELEVLLWEDNLNAYGWMWLTVGVLLIIAGFGVLSGSEWARWFGVFMAAVGAISSFLWIYEFPIWSLVAIIIAFSVIYGLVTEGGRDVSRTR